MKKIILKIFIIICILFNSNLLFSQSCLCSSSGSQSPSTTLTPTSSWQTVSAWGGYYTLFNVLNGVTYTWSFCSADGGSSGFDTRLNLYNNDGLEYITCNGDYCGLQAKIIWTADFSGVVRLKTNIYYTETPCSTNVIPQSLSTLAYKSSTCSNESYEPNNTCSSPSNFFPILSTTPYSGSLTSYISTNSDADWYNLNLSGAGTLSVDLTNLPNDYDLELWDLGCSLLAESRNGGTLAENIPYDYPTLACTFIRIKVYGYDNAYSCLPYTLSVDWTPSINCSDPSITDNPDSPIIISGEDASFTVSASGGTSPYSYQWQYSSNGGSNYYNLSNGGIYSCVTCQTLELTNVTTSYNNYRYRCIVNSGNPCGSYSSTSSSGILTVNPACSSPNIIDNPDNQNITFGDDASFTVSASGGTTPYSYQWQYSSNGGSNYYNLSNDGIYSCVTCQTLELTNVATSYNNYRYRCIVYSANPCGSYSSTSSYGMLTVSNVCSAPNIIDNPNSPNITSGDDASFTVSANSGTTPYSYQWQYSSNGGSNYYNLINGGIYSCVTCQTLELTNVTTFYNNYKFRCIVYSASPCDSYYSISGYGNMTVTPFCSAPSIVDNPGDQVITSGDNASFTVSASGGTTPYSYQWQYSSNGGSNYNNLSNGGIYSCVTCSTLQLANVTTFYNNYRYRCIVYSGSPCILYLSPSNFALLVVNDPSIQVPEIILSPVGTPNEKINPNIPNSEFKYKLHQSNTYTVGMNPCPSFPSAENWNWSFWERGPCAGGHSISSALGDRRWASDCNLSDDKDCSQLVYPVEDGWICSDISDPILGSWANTGENQVLIRHGIAPNEWYSGYLHMNDIISKTNGLFVSKNTPIGKISCVSSSHHCIPPNPHEPRFYCSEMTPHLDFGVYYKDPNDNYKLKSVHRTIVDRYVAWSRIYISPRKSIIPNAKIFYKSINDSTWYFIQNTDENGNSIILKMPPMVNGDSLRIAANNYEKIDFRIDDNILKYRTYIPMFKCSYNNSKVTNPSVLDLDTLLFYTSPFVNIKVTGLNYNSYNIRKVIDWGDSLSYETVISNNLSTDSISTLFLTDIGLNEFSILFKGMIDSVEIRKKYFYNPSPLLTYNVSINTDQNFIGAHVYINDKFIKDIKVLNSNISILPGQYNIQFYKFGYKDTLFYIDTNAVINLLMQPISPAIYTSSYVDSFDFSVHGKIHFGKNITVLDTSMLSNISIRQYNDNFTGTGLIPKSRRFDILHINSQWSNIRFAAVLDQVENLSIDSIYLMKIIDDTIFMKIPFDYLGNIAGYDSLIQKLTYNCINFNSGMALKEALVIMKKQPPVVLNPVINIHENDSMIIPLNLFFIDPDSIHNELNIQFNSADTGLIVYLQGNYIVLKPLNCWSRNVSFSLSARHDWIWRHKRFNVNLIAADNPIITYNSPLTFCEGDSVILTSSLSSFYNWSNGGTSQNVNILQSGNYFVNVTDAHGCQRVSLPISVTALPLPPANISANSSLNICDGTYTILSAPIGNFHYRWSTTDTNNSISVRLEGIYYLTVTDIQGCSNNSFVRVIVNPNPIPLISGQSSFCHGSSTLLSVGNNYSVYNWSNGETCNSIRVNSIGNYSVTVTDNNGCIGDTMVSITENPLPDKSIHLIGDSIICKSDIVMFYAQAGYNYLWNTGETTQSIHTGIEGPHYALITNPNTGCAVYSDTINVFHYPQINTNVLVIGSIHFCEGDSTILIGQAGYEYHWSTGETTQMIKVRQAGDYYLILKDNHNCLDTSEIIIINVYGGVSPPLIYESGYLQTESNYIDYQWFYGIDSVAFLPIQYAHYDSLKVFNTGYYYVSCVDTNGCVNSSNIIHVTVSGISELNTNEIINVYPNPNNGTFNIEIKMPASEKICIKIYDDKGKLIRKQKDNSNKSLYSIDIRNYSAGTYVVDIKAGNKVYRKKINISY